MSDDLLHAISSLLARIGATQFPVPEDSTLLSVEHDLVRTSLGMVREAAELMGRAEGLATEEEEVDLADLAFIGRLELGNLASQLDETVGRRKVWQALALAANGLSRSERALGALEREICERRGQAPPQRPARELDEALEIRRHYATLRTWLYRVGEPSGAQVLERLQEAEGRLARLRELDVYPLMRIDDRRQLRELLRRIATCLEAGRADGDAEALWQDLKSSGRLLLEINQRAELVRHDLEVLDQRHEAPSWAEDCVDLSRAYGALLGRDPGFDEVLLEPEAFAPAAGMERLAELRAALDRSSDPW